MCTRVGGQASITKAGEGGSVLSVAISADEDGGAGARRSNNGGGEGLSCGCKNRRVSISTFLFQPRLIIVDPCQSML